MTKKNESCFTQQQADETVIFLKDTVNIHHCEQLKTLLLQAIDFDKKLRIDMSDLKELDLSTLQLLCATKKVADDKKCPFIIAPVNEQSKSIIAASRMLDELIL